MARLAKLFESDDEDDKADDKMDNLAVQENMSKFMNKLDRHLDIEKVLIDEWATSK